MKRVLVVSYFYPPYSSVGATRVSKMTRYLTDAGWEAHVLTVDRCDLPATLPLEVAEDAVTRTPQLFDLASLPRAVVGRRRLAQDRVLPTQTRRWALLWRAGEIYRQVICFPDGQIGWWRSAAARGLELAREIKPDAILSSSLPNTSHLVARSIARATGIPWVAELRDLWTHNHNFRRVQPLRAVERRIERSVLSDASALVTVSDVWAEWLRVAYRRPTFVVPNGYDPNDYPSCVPPRSGPFTLAYTGMYYNGKQNVAPLLEAVSRLAARGRITPERFRVQFVGQYLGPVLAQATERGIRAFVDVRPPVAYSESLRLQCSAHALLFLDWFDDRATGWYSAKIYEYLGARRPVLSVGPCDTVVARLLSDARAGVTCADGNDVARVLECWIEEFERKGALAYVADEQVRARYERQQAARAMADVLDHVVGRAG
jgi:glycosyltransferase involved in cell wall biosynthesis